MKLLTIIGTRPQYIKIKPLYDYFKKYHINNILVDTSQHYSISVSSVFIKEFNLKIDYALSSNTTTPLLFISSCIKLLDNILDVEKPDCVIVIGDTNSTLAGSIAANKKNIKLVHIEAGIRCGDLNRPEEMNRILVDIMADIHCIAREKDKNNVKNPIYIGDLEYVLLNEMEKNNCIHDFRYDNIFLMTIHRAENTNCHKLNKIFKLCSEIKENIIFPIHHRTKLVIEKCNMTIPKNVKIIEPLSYLDMINYLSIVRGIITDSGGIVKISPFFGKKCLIPLETTEWTEVVHEGYGKLGYDVDFLRYNIHINRKKDFYLQNNCCELIIDNINNEIFKS